MHQTARRLVFRTSLPSIVSVLWLITGVSTAETIALPVEQDNSIVMVDGEWQINAGNSGRIRIKGNQHMVAMSFDTRRIAGKRVKRAVLECYAAAEVISGVTISTIATAWDEQRSNGLQAGVPDVIDWGYRGARFPAVCGGNSFTLTCHAQSKPNRGVYSWEIAPDLIHAMAIGIASGLAIHEHDADYGRNPTIFSREQSGMKPVLLVELDDAEVETPLPAKELELHAIDATTARLDLTAPPTGFAYLVTVNEVPLARHNIPLVDPGKRQSIFLRDLPAAVTDSSDHHVGVQTLSRNGAESQIVKTNGRLFQQTKLRLPSINPPREQTGQASPEDIAVVPLIDKFDRSGVAIGDLPADYRTHNRIYNGGRITLTALAGEVASFQLLLRGNSRVNVQLELSEPSWRVDRFEAVYVRAGDQQIPDPLVPLSDSLDLTSASDKSVVVDVYVPFDAPKGSYQGQLMISDGREIPLELKVLDAALPRRASFLCEMNSYGLPDHVDDFYALQEIAYDHRVHANILHYSHHTAAPGARKSNLDMRLRNGRRMDNKRYDSLEPGAKQGYWDDFIAAFGPYLDGSHFENGHRGAIPAPGFYLTFHESWPLNCRQFFNGNPDAYRAFVDSPAYAQTYVNVLRDFVSTAQQQGWTDTGFQVYFNNKGSLNSATKAPWILDEPTSYWDYRALQYYGELTDAGSDTEAIRLDYRIDISRPQFCRGQIANREDLWVVSSSAFEHYRRLVTDRIRKDGVKAWVYGTANRVEDSNRQALAWAIEAWQYGATGLVPWQTVNKSGEAMRNADQLGLFIFDRQDDGTILIRHSMRLKAFREAQQMIERLILVQQKMGWTQSDMRSFISNYVHLQGEAMQNSPEDAGTGVYDANELLQLEKLTLAVESILSD